jgi:hypothetical protein
VAVAELGLDRRLLVAVNLNDCLDNLKPVWKNV